MARTPVRRSKRVDTVETAAGPVVKKAHGKVRRRKYQAQKSQLGIPQHILEVINNHYEADLQWVTDSVFGKDFGQRREFEDNAWEPVTQEMFGGLLNGMFKKRDEPGEINYDGSIILMWRPMDLTDEAKAELLDAANDALMSNRKAIMSGEALNRAAPGFDPHHQTVRNRFDRHIGPPPADAS